jgi:tetratricopeptide (TPR) repeat protein
MARQRSPKDPLAPLRALMRAGRIEEAVDGYVARLEGPRPLVLDAACAPLCLVVERWEAARVGAERLLADGKREDRGRYHAIHARALLGLGRVDEAHAALVRARDLDPADPGVYVLEAVILRARGDLSGALHAAEGAVALDPQRADAHGLIAELLELLGRPEEALERLRDAVRKLGRDPAGHTRLLEKLAARLEARGEADEAAAARALLTQLRSPRPRRAHGRTAPSR